MNRVVDRASHVQLQEDRMVLQLFPQDFVVDDHPGHRDPRKMLASRLEINVHLVTTSVQEHNSLVGAVNQAHLAVEETVFEALAACYAAVLPEERREGIAVVDIGAESTELVVYYGDAMHLASTVRVCGDHFTRDLAQGLCISFEDAELVKLEYGCALAESLPENVAGGTAHAGESRAAARAAPLREPDSGSARRRAVPVCAHRTGPRGHGPRADGRRVPHRRRGPAAGSVRCRGARAAVPGALRPDAGNSGLAGRNERSGVEHGGGARDVFRQVKGTGRARRARPRAGWDEF